jgi:hypothetical protein
VRVADDVLGIPERPDDAGRVVEGARSAPVRLHGGSTDRLLHELSST